MKIPENEVGEEVAPCYVGDKVGDVFTFFPWQAPLNPLGFYRQRISTGHPKNGRCGGDIDIFTYNINQSSVFN